MTPEIPPELSEQDAELLSAYLDKQLADSATSALEARLKTDAFLRAELAALRQTVAWLHDLPSLQAPRDFTLTSADVKTLQVKPIIRLPRRNLWMTMVSAAAVLLIAIGLGAVLVNQPSFSPTQSENAAGGQIAFAVTTTPIPSLSAELQNFTALGSPAPTMTLAMDNLGFAAPTQTENSASAERTMQGAVSLATMLPEGTSTGLEMALMQEESPQGDAPPAQGGADAEANSLALMMSASATTEDMDAAQGSLAEDESLKETEQPETALTMETMMMQSAPAADSVANQPSPFLLWRDVLLNYLHLLRQILERLGLLSS